MRFVAAAGFFAAAGAFGLAAREPDREGLLVTDRSAAGALAAPLTPALLPAAPLPPKSA